MNRINPKRVAVFFFVFAAIAVVIHTAQGPIEQQRAAAIEQQQHAKDATATHAQYLARYVNPGFARRPGTKTVAIAVATDDGSLNRAVTTALESRFQHESVWMLSPFFKPEFVSDGLFKDAFAGSGEVLNKLELANLLDGIVLAQQNVQYTQNSALDNVITATMQLKVAVVPVSGQSDSKTWTFTASGAGFTKEVARQAAEERLIKQIATDTKMSLTAITSNH